MSLRTHIARSRFITDTVLTWRNANDIGMYDFVFPNIEQSRMGSLPKRVKNLGWLIRNNRNLVHPLVGITFEVRTWRYAAPYKRNQSVGIEYFNPVLISYMENGRAFATQFADRSFLLEWLDRPVFQGYSLYWEFIHESKLVQIGGYGFKEFQIEARTRK